MATATKAKTGPLVVVMDFEKETPGTLRFKEQERPNSARPFIGTFYLTKEGVSSLGGNTSQIEVTVRAVG